MCSSNLGAEYGFALTDENYYSREADIYFMSCSQFQAFEKCEAAEIAKLRGIWTPEETSDALFQGQYFHSYFNGEDTPKDQIQLFANLVLTRFLKSKKPKHAGWKLSGNTPHSSVLTR